MCIGAFDLLRGHNMIVPDDISTINFDDVSIYAMLAPAGSTAHSSIKKMATIIDNNRCQKPFQV